MNWINEVHPYIKFDFKFSNKEINFLDIVLYKTTTSKLGTKLYTKDIYWQAYLHSKSKHPDSLKHSIPFEETLHLRCICTVDKGFQLNCYEWGYKELEINASIQRTHTLDRKEFLKSLIHYDVKVLYITQNKRTQKRKWVTSPSLFRNRATCVVNELYIQAVLQAIPLKESYITLAVKVNL